MSSHNSPDADTQTVSVPSSIARRSARSRYLRMVVMSATVIAIGSYAYGVASTAAPEVDEGAAFGVCVYLAPGFDACRDDDGTLVLGDGLGADGLPLFTTAPAYTEAQ